MTIDRADGHSSRMRRVWVAILTAAALMFATAANYVGWLGWHPHDEVTVPPNWQVTGLVLVQVALIIGVQARRLSMLLPLVDVPATLTATWALQASQQPTIGANIWPVGAIFLFVGATLATMTICGLAQGLLNGWRVFRKPSSR